MERGVVIVDDAPDLRMLVALAIERDGRLQVLASVGDGEQGLQAVRRHAPDVVLMDVSMPVMDGLSATRRLKEEFPGLPVVIFTGFGDARLADEATRAGADAFLDKGQPMSVVLDRLADLAGRA